LASRAGKKIFSLVDRNLLGRSIEAGPLEDPNTEPLEEIYLMTKSADT